ncbi:MAG: carbohydrate porin [Bacteroidota bacterium]
MRSKLPFKLTRFFALFFCSGFTAFSQNDSIRQFNGENYSAEGFDLYLGRQLAIGGQLTCLYQHQSALNKPKYDGPISISSSADDQILSMATLNLLIKLWKRGEFVISPEMQLGNGIGNGKGMGAYPNALYGNPQSSPYLLRAHYRHHFFFKNSTIKEYQLTVGRYALMEMFDMNPYASDPKKDFFNFSHTMLNAWDAAITAYGYTHGLAQTLKLKKGSVSLSVNTHNENAGGPETDWNISQAYSFNLQLVKNFQLFGKTGKVRLLGFYNSYNGGNFSNYYKDSLTHVAYFDTLHSYTTKLGGGIDINYDLNERSGLFLRYSQSDGLYEDYGYTQCDASINGGALLGMNAIKRPMDRFGICASVNMLSSLHQQFLKDGGTGFMLGDGNLNYAPETILETLYCMNIKEHFFVTLNYQYAINVGYNLDRGNAHFLGIRLNLTL